MNSRIGKMRLGVVLVGLLAEGVLAGGGSALAQTANYPPGGPKLPKWSEMADWDSVWERGGDLVWDDRIPPGVPQVPPYNADYQKLFEEALAKNPRGGRPGGPPGAAPAANRPAGAPQGGGMRGMPGMMTMLRPMEVQVNPHEVLLVSENGAIRRIFTDGRLQPADPLPNAVGHSIGHWKNKELIVDTCCMDPTMPLPGFGPRSDAMHITERFYSPKPNMLVDEMSVEDPKAFTKPWTTVKTFYRRPDWELLVLPGGGGGAGGGAAPGAPPAEVHAADPLSLSKGMVNVDGMNRSYSFYVSTKAKRDAFNYVVFALPDNGQTTEEFAKQSGWVKMAEDNGFAVIFPEPADKTWSAIGGGEDRYLEALWNYAQSHLTPPGGMGGPGGMDGPGGPRGPRDAGGPDGAGGPGGPGLAGAGPREGGPAADAAAEGGGGPRAGRGPQGVPHWFAFEYMTGSGVGGRIAQEFAVSHPGRFAAVATLNGAPFRATYVHGDEPSQAYLQYMRPGKEAPPQWKQLKKEVPVAVWMFNSGAATPAQIREANYWKQVDRVALAPANRAIDGFQTAVYSDPANNSQQVRITTLPASAKYDEAMTSAIFNDFFVHVGRWTSSPNGDLGSALSEAEVNKMFDVETVNIEGVSYKYYLKLPSSYRKGKALPLVLSAHGANFPAWMYLSQIKMHEVGEKEGFITVYLNADHQHWDFTQPNSRSAKFIQQVVDEVISKYGADRSRVYMQGFSFGSGMTLMMGLAHPQMFAAVSPNNGIGDFSKDVMSWLADLKAKSDIRMPTFIVYGDVDSGASTDASIPAGDVLQHAIDYQKVYNHIATKDRIETYDSPHTAPYDVLIPGARLVRAGVDKRYPEGRFKIYTYMSADPKPLNLFDFVWVTDLSHGGDFREAQLEWDYFKKWRRNPDGSLTYIEAAVAKNSKQ
jgi:poly(3-hydroxybutyrate) depolymerase